ncbi:vacuolar protein sorting-associated protein 37A-like [Biomphalaria glabrata]|uniref:Vacuolar protein sorting-associated protein 37A-like n=1 Tax=Biomphalaria glabrata TaxID=6526 RepID=A0A2C9LPA1_BIOGL|nr:vacuolar protein sorting-associated protein 37A-like [Biomphalaria glabrata]XP_055895540.1 vacuolar protein sorting-associated protein 37A-like [Biomphalaria glabrata]XP_055895541.1 vacuolar protein sorting-associated protein 37A-like [Biomphalaria glabrata]XP_055895542.1 vacuolar protein sorting-associated protein 37A-like [Biomphalaria glabrata]XP_055895543.1 vacuolar protein sorting-associated protein 37A-like [Biomphalaria glabrata]XP_055895544.1 vacuolar protein sorting-associated prot
MMKMNRLFGGGKHKGQATNLQAQRAKQIESLKKLGAHEILKDTEYRVVTQQGGTNLTLQINLPAQFPSEKPILTVQPAVTHPWVDLQMKVVGCPNINNFSMHSDLGQAVQAVLEEFKKSPPAIVPQHYILGSSNPTIGSAVTKPGGPLPSYPGFNAYPGSQPSAIPPPLPPRRPPSGVGDLGLDQLTLGSIEVAKILSEFPALKDMKIHELNELSEDEDKIMEMIQKAPDLGKFIQQREALASTCVQLAQSNLSKKSEIENLRKILLAKSAELDNLKIEFENHCERHMSLSDEYHPSHIQTNLKVAVMEADEESEVVAEKFLDKELDVDEFLKSFMEKRTLCHLRRAKEEKLNQIILSQGLRY